MATGKCPSCGKVAQHVNVDNVDVVTIEGSPKWNGIVCKCPHCNTILSASIDPVALKTDIVEEILERLGR